MMADSSLEKTEQPTGKRLSKAREEGNIPRSMDLAAAAITIVSMIILTLSGSWMFKGMVDLFKSGLSFDTKAIQSPHAAFSIAAEQVFLAGGFVLPLILMTAVVAIAASLSMGGFNFTLKPTLPHFEKLDIVQGMARIFGSHAWIELGKSLLKFGLVSIVLVVVLNGKVGELNAIGRMGLENAIAATGSLVMESILWVTLALVAIALIDVPLQQYLFYKRLRMTKQEVRDEMKEAEVSPEVRGKIKARQREIAMAKMMRRVKDADVIITNPEHFAVALSYDPTADAPPVLVAKGVDHLAQRIREEGAQHGVMVFEAPPLARALYFTTELEHPVPEELYFAVAQVIAYVYSLSDVRPGEPQALRPVPRVPRSMWFDARGQRQGEQGVAA
ncbi:MAG: flagellar biosynthesis protein FlhB [Betaproteobacteria bacterium]|nr:flagellar biosynthesis protein FlhB [Betaproteobacteria bacterium]